MHYSLWVTGNDVETQLEAFREDNNPIPASLGRLYSIDAALEQARAQTLEELIQVSSYDQVFEKHDSPVLIFPESCLKYLGTGEEFDALLGSFRHTCGQLVLITDGVGKVTHVARLINREHWDFYVVGGRWDGQLLATPNAGLANALEWEGNSQENGVRYNVLQLGEIDFERMEAGYEETQRDFGLLRERIRRHPEYQTFEAVLRRIEEAKESTHLAYSRWREQPALKGTFNYPNLDHLWVLRHPELLDHEDLETVMRVVKASNWLPCNLLHEGVWLERELGKNAPEFLMEIDNLIDWYQRLTTLFSTLPKDTLITVVDYHN